MSRDAKITQPFADDDYEFRLGWGELAELQEKVNAGPYVVLQRVENGTWRIEDVSNIIRLGLIGGGMKPTDALAKVRTYVEKRPPLENLMLAHAIIMAGLLGAPDEPAGEAGAPSQMEAEAP